MSNRNRRSRLTRSAEFERVYRHGRSRANRYLVLYSFPRPEGDDDGRRLGLSVPRRVGGAVQRNQVKRLLREAFWASSEGLESGHDYVVVARPEVAALADRDGLAGVRGALHELLAGERTSRAAEGEP